MNEVVERGAAAICRTLFTDVWPPTSWRQVDGLTADQFREAFRAAVIEALRDPTKEMIDAGVDADIPGGEWGSDAFRESSVDENDVPVIWRAMIDELLRD